MDFNTALTNQNVTERDCQIAAEIVAHDWLDYVATQMQHGGWPELATPRVGRIDADERELRVQFFIDYTELCPQGCNAYPRRYVDTAVGQLTIDRHSGIFSLRHVS